MLACKHRLHVIKEKKNIQDKQKKKQKFKTGTALPQQLNQQSTASEKSL